MLKTHEAVLEKIIELDGDCLDAKNCSVCPFAALCLPEFLNNKTSPSKENRVQMALDAITRNSLMDDDKFPEKDNDKHR